MNKKELMKYAIKLAKKGGTNVFPNPQVGAVIVKNGKIISEGYHRYFGDKHAEIHAIQNAKEDLTDSEMFVTLEPCSHYGKTPPCVDSIIQNKIKKVYVGIIDPNPLVRGKGIKKLKEAGIEVEVGILQEELKRFYRDYSKRFLSNKQKVVLKYAMTIDGKIATKSGDSKWISNDKSRKLVYKLRSQFDGILVGVNTIIKDDPVLTSHGEGKNPIRIIVDPDLIVPVSRRVFSKDSPVVIVHSIENETPKMNLLRKKGVILVKLKRKKTRLNFQEICDSLNRISISSILIEGGGETSWYAIKDKVVDEIIVFIAPKLVGGKDAITPIEGEGIRLMKDAINLKLKSFKKISSDLMLNYEVIYK